VDGQAVSDALRGDGGEIGRADQRSAATDQFVSLLVPMRGRDPSEAHRTVTPLELFLDLAFVVAVAQAASELHHALANGMVAYGLALFFIVFFGVWWPWVNFTWFASAYDTDDVPYRLLTFVQIVGVLVVAAGAPRAFGELDFSITVLGYVIMRIALVAQWLRAARGDPAGRPVALRFAIGIGMIQLLWIVRLAIGGPIGVALIIILGVVELLIPWWAEHSGRPTPWHPGHIAERYSLFTIIVLGESVLAATVAFEQALRQAGLSVGLVAIAVGGLAIVFAMWWAYFKAPASILWIRDLPWQFAWGYGHFVVFFAAAAVGAGLQVAIDSQIDPDHVSSLIAGMAVALPVLVYMWSVAILHRRGQPWLDLAPLVLTAVLALGVAAAVDWIGVPLGVLLIGVVAAGTIAWHLAGVRRVSAPRGQPEEGVEVT
jgi:low temperature requirement protein LtrA